MSQKKRIIENERRKLYYQKIYYFKDMMKDLMWNCVLKLIARILKLNVYILNNFKHQ